jgi:HSP20 family protein
MAVVRYTQLNPWRELDQIGNRLSQMFETNGTSATVAWMPAVSVEETQDAVLLTAELPGVQPADLDINVENNVLTLKGEKRAERNEQDEARRYHVWERSYGAFQRSFTLPRTVKADQIEAEFENGLLKIRMPKAPEAMSRKIEVKAAGAAPAIGGQAESQK